MPRKTEDVTLDEFVPEKKVETTIAPPEMPNLKLPEDYVPLSRPEPYDAQLLRDWWEFVRNVPPDAPYDLLNQLPFHRGFVYKIEQDHIEVLDQSILVTFAIRIGRHMDDLRYLDQFSIQVPRNTVAPTMAARSIMAPSAIYTVFGRLPPEAPPVPAPAPAAPEPAPAPAPVRPAPVETDAPWQAPKQEMPELDIVDGRTPDGLPLITNLYNVDSNPDGLARMALDVLEDALASVGSQAQLTALWNKNAAAIEFVKDFGGDGGKTRLAEMFKERAAQLRRG